MHRRMVVLPLLAALLAGGSSVAWTMTFFGEDPGLGDGGGPQLVRPLTTGAHGAFLGICDDPRVDDLEDELPTDGPNTLLEFGPLVYGDVQGVLDGPFEQAVGDHIGRYPFSGDQYWESRGPADAGPNLLLDMLFVDDEFGTNIQTVKAFGFYASDLGDYNKQLSVSFFDLNFNLVAEMDVPHTLAGGVWPGPGPNPFGGMPAFFGYANSDGFSYVQIWERFIGNPQDSVADGVGFDDFIISTQIHPPSIPEPSTLALFGLGAAGLIRRRRR